MEGSEPIESLLTSSRHLMYRISIILALLIASSTSADGSARLLLTRYQTLEYLELVPQPFETPTEFTLLPSSRLWIEGSTSLNSFSCNAESLYVYAVAATPEEIEASVEVPVAELECGRGRMNQDLRDAMSSEAHPNIEYRLISATPSLSAETANGSLSVIRSGEAQNPIQTSEADSDERPVSLVTQGYLTVAGVERKVSFDATAQQTGSSNFRIHGRLPIRMTEYSITPPRALGGLIRVRDEIVVEFDLMIAAKPQTSISLPRGN